MKPKLLSIVCIFMVIGIVLAGCTGDTSTPTGITPSPTETLEDILKHGTSLTNVTFGLTSTIPDMPSGEIKMWIKGPKARMDVTAEGQTVALIFDTSTKVQYTYIPAQKVAQKASLTDSDIDILANFSPGIIAGEILRQKTSVLGTETLNGKVVLKIQGTGDNGKKYNAWISKDYGIPLKLASAEPGDNMVVEWKNIDVSAIPDSVFEVPGDVKIVLPDTTLPTVGSTSPTLNAAKVMVNTPITATFSEEMKANTITSASFTLKSNDKPVSGKVTCTGNMATFTPTEELGYSTTYTVTVTKQVTDLAGNGLSADYSWTFKTRDAGILEGALNYVGPYPKPALVSYIDKSNKQVSVTAYPGQIQVYYDSKVAPAEVEALIKAKGGTILGKIPLIGYYLVQVTIGQEGSFINALRTDSRLKLAIPNIALSLDSDGVVINQDFINKSVPVPLNVTGPVIIDAGDHGKELQQIARDNGGDIKNLVEVSATSGGYFGADKVAMTVAAVAQGSQIFDPGKPVFINLSNSAGAQLNGEWVDYKTLDSPVKQQAAVTSFKDSLLGKLQTVNSLPEELVGNRLVISQSAGNSNMDISQPLQEIRVEYPGLGLTMRDNVTIVTTEQSPTNIDRTRYPSGKVANSAPGDKDVVKVNFPEAAKGTSFAAVSNLLWALKLQKEVANLTPDQVNAALKMAAISDSYNRKERNWATAMEYVINIKNISDSLMKDGKYTREQVTQAMWLAEGISAATALFRETVETQAETISSAPDDPIAAIFVTGIKVTTQNGIVATATITPAIAGVTIRYTVAKGQGQGPIFKYGTVKTDASGRASFSVPAGECEEWYTYTVTAVFSGKTATTRFMFYYE